MTESKIKVTGTAIDGVFLIEPTVYGDARGYFFESYQRREFQAAGITADFIQDNQSSSSKHVLRGLHFQKQYPQAKLVRVLSGEVFDVALDLRKDSRTYGNWVGEILSAENHKQLFIPRGCAHGFLVLSETAEFTYKCDEYYHPEDEGGLAWDDPDLNIAWPLPEGVSPVLSQKDGCNPSFREFTAINSPE